MTKFEFSGSGHTVRSGGIDGRIVVLGAIGVAAALILEWMWHRVWWLLGITAGLVLLLFGALLLLMRLNARWNAQYTQRYAQVGAQLREELPAGRQAAVPVAVTLQLQGPEAAEAVARLLMHRELPGSASVEISSDLCRISTFPPSVERDGGRRGHS